MQSKDSWKRKLIAETATVYTHAYNSYEFHFKSVDELLIEFLIEQKANHEESRF